MAGTQPVLGSTAVAAMTSSAAAMTTAGAGGSVHPPAEVLTNLLEDLATLMEVEVTPGNQEQHKVDVAKLRDEITQAKVELAAENARMTAERTVLNPKHSGFISAHVESEHLKQSLDKKTLESSTLGL